MLKNFRAYCCCSGYDGLPVEELQGMGIGSHPGSTYGQVQDMDMGGHQGDMGHFDTDMPQPPQDNNQVTFDNILFITPWELKNSFD